MPKRILVADSPRATADCLAILAGHDVIVRAHDRGSAAPAARSSTFNLVMIGVHFDDSRMFDLLRHVRASGHHGGEPMACVRSRRQFPVPPAMRHRRRSQEIAARTPASAARCSPRVAHLATRTSAPGNGCGSAGSTCRRSALLSAVTPCRVEHDGIDYPAPSCVRSFLVSKWSGRRLRRGRRSAHRPGACASSRRRPTMGARRCSSLAKVGARRPASPTSAAATAASMIEARCMALRRARAVRRQSIRGAILPRGAPRESTEGGGAAGQITFLDQDRSSTDLRGVDGRDAVPVARLRTRSCALSSPARARPRRPGGLALARHRATGSRAASVHAARATAASARCTCWTMP